MAFDYTPNEQFLIDRAALGQHRRPCPWCSGSRKRNKAETCLAVNRDDSRIVYACHHCGVSGIVPLTRREKTIQKVDHVPAIVRKKEDFDPIDDRHIDWLSGRGISAATAHKYGLVATEIEGNPAIGFPYFDDKGNIVALKKRSILSKDFRCAGSPQTFFGTPQLKKGEPLVVVEGEADLLALAEVGISAVSVPNGAPMKVTEGRIDPSEDGKFKFLWAAKEFIDAAERIVIATDADGPGEALAEEIARRVGKERCWRVEFPDGIKDSNEALVKLGKDHLRKIVSEAKPWPVAGLYDAYHFKEQVWTLYEKGVGRGDSTGYASVDEFYTIVPGQVTIVTGIPSSGKSTFINQVMVNLARDRSWKFGICSFEYEPRLHISSLMSMRTQQPFFEGPSRRMNAEEARAAFDWVQDHFTFVWQDDGGLANLDSILDRLRISILRHGIRGAVIDPYNFISRDSRDKSETEWISDMLTKVKAFAMGHGIHIWFVAHPTKMQRGADGKIPAPGGFDISGSAAWFAKADCGMTVHRDKDEPGISQIHIWKCRFSWVGKQGQANLIYDVRSSSYYEVPEDYERDSGFEL